MVTQIVDKSAWLLRSISGGVNYGNGTGDYVTVGPVPAAGGGQDYKCRGVHSVSLTTLFTDLTTLSAGTIELTVAPETCGPRGATQRLFLEEVTSGFNENTATGNCGISGTGATSGEWPGPDATQEDRAFLSDSGLSTGDKLTFDCLDLLQRKLDEFNAGGGTTLRFRIIAANGAGDAYDESNDARTVSYYSHRHATSGNRPVVSVTGSGAGVAKSMSDGNTSSTDAIVLTKTGSGTVQMEDDGQGFDDIIAGFGPQWATVLNAMEEGSGRVALLEANTESISLLDDVSAADLSLSVRFKINVIPVGGVATFSHCFRADDISNHYRFTCEMLPDQSMDLVLYTVIAGVETELLRFEDAASLLVGVDFWLQCEAVDDTPTTLRGKIWREGASNPDWQIVTLDSELSLQTAGTIGLHASVGAVTSLPVATLFDEYTAREPTP